jgi:uncharacterized DUF497 family protein
MRFVWDPNKAARNLAEHGVSFEEAATAFSDQKAVYLPDKSHPERGNLIGHSASSHMLFVVHIKLLAELPPTTRIISARKASARQNARYMAQFEPSAKRPERRQERAKEKRSMRPLHPKQRRIRHEED